MTIPAGVVEALNAALVDGADSNTALKLALTGYELVPAGSQPVAFTETCEITNMQATGLYLRGFPTGEQGRNIPLFVEPQHNPALVTFPRCTFKETSPDRYVAMRGDVMMGTVYRFGSQWFIDLPQQRIGDVPGYHSMEQAMGKVSSVLDCPA